jgi:hypothetical protein
MDEEKIPLPDPSLVLSSAEPERPAEAFVLGRPNTRSSSSPLWTASRLPPLRRSVLRPIDSSGIPFAGPSRELRPYPGAKRRIESETNSGRRTRQRESDTPGQRRATARYRTQSLGRASSVRFPSERETDSETSSDEDEESEQDKEDEAFEGLQGENPEEKTLNTGSPSQHPEPTAPELEDDPEMSATNDEREELIRLQREQARLDAENIALRLEREAPEMSERELAFEEQRLQYLRDKAKLPQAAPRTIVSAGGSYAASVGDESRPSSAPVESMTGNATPASEDTIYRRHGAFPKSNTGLGTFSTPSFANLTLINRDTRQADQEAYRQKQLAQEQEQREADFRRIQQNLSRRNETIFQERIAQINRDRQLAIETLRRDMALMEAEAALSHENVELIEKQVQEDLPILSPGGSTIRGSAPPPKSIKEPFMHITQALKNLNTRDRDEQRLVRDTNQHLRRVTGERVELSLEASLRKHTDQQDAKYAAALVSEKESILAETRRMLALQEHRLRKVEENERLTSRVGVEKKDACLPIASHPQVDADDTAMQKANVAMGRIATIAGQTFPYSTDPFNHVVYICAESNKIALSHRLSARQHRLLILDAIPSQTNYHKYLEEAESLQVMFAMVSIYATTAMTRTELELAINKWRLDGSSSSSLFASIIDLNQLMDKNREDYQLEKPNQPQLFKAMISRIMQQADLPYAVREALQTARMRIRPEDKMDELATTLNAACQKYIGYKHRGMQSKKANTADQSNPLAIEYNSGGAKITADPPKPAPKIDQPKGKNQGGQAKGTAKTQGDGAAGSDRQKSQGRGRGYNKGRGNKKRPSFVRPWPADKPYMSKSGNQLLKEFNDWFSGYCSKCGFANHAAKDCKTYPEKHTVLTCCTKCYQGLHEVCRSRRRDLVGQDTIVKRLESFVLERERMRPPPQPIYYPYTPAPGQFANAVAVPGQLAAEEEDE